MIPAAETLLSDIETTAIRWDSGGRMILPDTVHLLISRDYERGETYVFGPDREHIAEGVDHLSRSKTVIFHNGRGFDELVLAKHFGFKARDPKHLLDSMVLTKLFYSNVKAEEDFTLFEKSKRRKTYDPLKFTGKMINSHSLEAWGLRLNPPFPKGNYSQRMKFRGLDPWAEWNPDMQEYAIQDVVVLEALWDQRLRKRMTHDVRHAVAVEHYLADLMIQVKSSGIRFDDIAAHSLVEDLEEHESEAVVAIHKAFPPRMEPQKWEHRAIEVGMPDLNKADKEEFCAKLNSDNEEDQRRVNELRESGPQQQVTSLMWDHRQNQIYRPRFILPEGYIREQYGVEFTPKMDRTVKLKGGDTYQAKKGSTFVKCQMVELNPSSRPQIIRRLLELGWVPDEFTDAGNPVTSESELAKIESDFPVAKPIADYLLIQKRLGAIKTGAKAWLKLMSDEKFIHPTIHPNATVTFRAAHSDPNVSQVPSIKMVPLMDGDTQVHDANGKPKLVPGRGKEGKWGYDCRACFTVPEGFVMVGSDLAGIEMRCWAHYLHKYDNGRFANIILNADVHEENRVILGFNDRRKAKEWLYACVPFDTQALTRRGWKTYDELIIGEEILTYNPDTKLQEWQPLLETVTYESAPIIQMSIGHGFRVRSTPNHRWFTQRNVDGRIIDEVTTTEDISSHHGIIQECFADTTRGDAIKEYVTSEAVWCPRTHNGSWVMRQGDTITITGNTMYGAGDAKLGFIIDPTATSAEQKSLGEISRSRFMTGMVGFNKLNEKLMKGVSRGYLVGLDNRRIPVRKEHAALNSCLQCAGAVISKYWIIYVMDILENKHGMRWGYDKDFTLMIYSHDELQFACRPEFADIIRQACVDGALKAGERLKFKMPVDVETVVGKNWAETH